MSKFLKFIVHFVVICTIICVAGLVVPPFLGITTQIMNDSGKETNLPIGSVTYAIPVKTEEAAVGDNLLVQEESRVYRYKITAMDFEKKLFTVVDPTVSNAESITVAVKDYVPKVVVTVGYLGYLFIATESIEGLIVLGLAVLFLVILYLLAELWKKDPRDDYEDEDTEPGYVKSKKELKREEKAKARLYKEEEREIRREDKQRKKKGKKSERKKIRTGGFVDEIYEDDFDMEETEQPSEPVQNVASEAHEVLKKEIAAVTAEEPVAQLEEALAAVGNTVPVTDQVKEALEEKAQQEEQMPEEEEEPAEIRKMAIPLRSAAQLAEEAKNQGDAPEIVRDNITNVTLFDYSDIISGEDLSDEPPVK